MANIKKTSPLRIFWNRQTSLQDISKKSSRTFARFRTSANPLFHNGERFLFPEMHFYRLRLTSLRIAQIAKRGPKLLQ